MSQYLFDLDKVPDGATVPLKMSNVTGEPRHLVLARRGEEVFLYLNFCPHAGRPLGAGGRLLVTPKDELVCAAHGAVFNVDGGLCTAGPCEGEHLVRFETVVKDGEVWLVGEL